MTASDVLSHELHAFREEQEVPVVAVILEKGLSGGYYVALLTSPVGSVGVLEGGAYF